MSSLRSSVPPQLLIPPGIKDVTKFVRVNRVSNYQYESAGFGGSAEVFRGTYRPRDGSVIEVAIKCIRATDFDGRDPKYEQKMQKKLARELEIWRTLSTGNNIIQLLGTMTGIGPMPALVCQLCSWNLQDYLERKTPPPKHIQMMTDTLKGLSYMHELKPSPVAHGDIKSHNILVTADEKALICDFGRSRHPHDQPRVLSGSSPFGATPRYMSPELFEPGVIGPTSASDMWAYGCVALEILCRILPYQDITNDFEITELIKQGRAPSDRPRGARASLISDALWATLSSCWREQAWRPTSRMFLERLTQMLRNGEVSASPILMEMFPLAPDGPLIPWPEELIDLSGSIEIEEQGGMIASSLRSSVWVGTLGRAHRRTNESTVVIKVPRLNVGSQNLEPHNHLQHVIRKTVKTRYGVRHQNVIDLLGIDSTFTPHAGLVLEYCARGNLTVYCKQNRIDINATDRPSSPLANAYSLISDILEALQYLHNFPVPITQGDLTPDNILVNASGIAKIGLFSFGRMISAIPAAATITSSVGPLLPFRWMSPELLTGGSNPTTESDMWSMGCVSFWLLTGLRPYAGHLRDDFAGVESVRGLPPGSIERIDRANTLGERMIISRESSWITNGIWSLISKCWTVDPLQRPSARVFLSFMKNLKGRDKSWMPVGVKDLAGKVERGDPVEDQLWMYQTVWKQYESGRLRFKENIVHMVLVKTTHKPNWYSKMMPVAVKQAFSYATSLRTLDDKPYIPSIRHEIAISAQLNHPNICKLIGVDSSFIKVPSIIFEYCSEVNLYTYLMRNEPTFQESARIVKDVASALVYIHEHPNGTIAHGNLSEQEIFISDDGQAKLTNFTCSFQYIMHESRKMTPLSLVTSTKYGPSPSRSPEYYKDLDENHVPLPTVASDIWAFGCVIVNTFTKQAAFFSPDDAIILAKLNEGIAPYSAEQLLKLDHRVLPIVQKMFAWDANARPTAREVLKCISELLP